MTAARRRVVIVQEVVPHYRVPFFEQLLEALADEGVAIGVVHGAPSPHQAARADSGVLPWARTSKTFRLGWGRSAPVVQPAAAMVGADLVVVEQASRMVANYVLFARQAMRGPRVALWGHGENLQASGSGLSRCGELVKRSYSRWPTWWFAYTEGAKERVAALGFPRDRITVVQNTIDTSDYRDPPAFPKLAGHCIFVGGIYPEKRPELLVEVADHLAGAVPQFHLTVVGGGQSAGVIAEAARTRRYLDYRGPVFGQDRADLVQRSSLILMPGLVGLIAIDSFAAGTPLVTTTRARHSPEFEYLRNERNALVLDTDDAESFASDVARLLADNDRMTRLREGCVAAAADLALDVMVRRFAEGVTAALRTAPIQR